jgi:hypothetical protein
LRLPVHRTVDEARHDAFPRLAKLQAGRAMRIRMAPEELSGVMQEAVVKIDED